MGHVIRRLNTGWIDSTPAISLLAAGQHPAAEGGRLRPYRGEVVGTPDPRSGAGDMVPSPVWYLEADGRRILVDAGSPPSARIAEGGEDWLRLGAYIPPTGPEPALADQLGELGVGPDDVEIVVLTHLHWDHVGHLEMFPNATFVAHREELSWALAPPPYMYWWYGPSRRYVRAVLDRMQLIDTDQHEVVPGVRMVRTGGHSPGHCIVLVETDVGRVCLTGDAAYNYRNLEYEWPTGIYVDVRELIGGMRTVKALGEVIVLHHCGLFETLFPTGSIGDAPLPEPTRRFMASVRADGSLPRALSTYVDGAALALSSEVGDRQQRTKSNG